MSQYKARGWDGIKAIPKPGRPVRFTKHYRRALYEIISKHPHSWGYETDLWSVRMARDVLYEQTGEHFSKTRILSAFHELGLSFQKPEIRALEKNGKVTEWLNEVFPGIIEESTFVGAKVYFEDESGISLNIFSGRT